MNIAVLLSGTGRSLANFIDYIKVGKLPVQIAVVISSRKNVRGNEIARDAGIPLEIVIKVDHGIHFDRRIFDILDEAKVELACMAGFLRFLDVPKHWRNKVMNIHPSLLPSFGGQGFFGNKVHEAVIDRGCKVTGCTVHFVDHHYDHGPIILQRAITVHDDDTPEALSARVFAEECRVYPDAVRLFAEGRLQVRDGRVWTLPAR